MLAALAGVVVAVEDWITSLILSAAAGLAVNISQVENRTVLVVIFMSSAPRGLKIYDFDV